MEEQKILREYQEIVRSRVCEVEFFLIRLEEMIRMDKDMYENEMRLFMEFVEIKKKG